MIKFQQIINFLEIIFLSFICYITITYHNFFEQEENNNYVSFSSSNNWNDNDYDEIYYLKQQRKIYIDLLKDKNLDFMKNDLLNKINNIDERLIILNANMNDLDIIIF